MITEILTRAPIWVWPLLIALVVFGLFYTRDYQMPKPRLLIMPITFSITALITVTTSPQLLVSIITALTGAVFFTFIGRKYARRSGAYLNTNGKIWVPGEWLTLGLFISIFALRFITGVVTEVSPQTVASVSFAGSIAFMMGGIAGTVIGRAYYYWTLFNQPTALDI